MSSAGANTKCGKITARNTFISRMANFHPRQECGPSENDMTFARPGFVGARAFSGRLLQRSGLIETLSEWLGHINDQNVHKLSRIFSPNFFAHIESFNWNMHVTAFPNEYSFRWRNFGAVTQGDWGRDRDGVILSGGPNCTMHWRTQSQRLTNHTVQVWQSVNSICMSIFGVNP